MKTLIMLLAVIPTLAFASPGDDGCIGNCGGGSTNPSTTISNRIDNNTRASAKAFAGATSSSKASLVSNPILTNENATTASVGPLQVNSNYEAIRNTPSIALGGIYPSANCHGTSNVGASGYGWGVGFGSSWSDDDCQIRETARSFSGLGLKDDAVSVLCSSKYAKIAPICAPKE